MQTMGYPLVCMRYALAPWAAQAVVIDKKAWLPVAAPPAGHDAMVCPCALPPCAAQAAVIAAWLPVAAHPAGHDMAMVCPNISQLCPPAAIDALPRSWTSTAPCRLHNLLPPLVDATTPAEARAGAQQANGVRPRASSRAACR